MSHEDIASGPYYAAVPFRHGIRDGLRETESR